MSVEDAKPPLPGAGRAADRQDLILDAAFHAFATYGFRRTTMDDIARGVGISRSALYLHYRNKDDVFRTLAERYFNEAIAAMEAALTAPGQTPEQALIAAFVAKDGKFMDVVLDTPHGSELLDAGMSLTQDLADRAQAQKIGILARWLAALPMADGIGSPETVARTIMVSAMGLKFPGQTLDGYRTGQRQLARLFARAITG
ncbi:TetR/AcrR family transcriptional regulator [Pseudorhodobacter sp. MZDSW-24AT]|uniref:TetR/AcrR family transcriptional regulator n=1 Tax=Pseudorhodobacter sp. MZDSW-24AT TaxID=2052957 RepID=UPI0012FE1AE8|nr:TetR/AcrR family transcriptional regulator [Pseudorhodobacter sp. MZDSW-24AT]